nr:CoA transferase [Modestobacter roseus]
MGAAVRGDGPRAESTYFFSANRNKESIALDLKDDADKAVLTELLRRADVLLENFRPGTLARLGFGTDVLAELNPRLVQLSISGFGHDGPEGQRAGYDQIAQGEAGLMSLTGAARTTRRRWACRSVTCWPACTAPTACSPRCTSGRRTGRGQVVRTSLLASVVGVHAFQGTAHTVAGRCPAPRATTTPRSPRTASSAAPGQRAAVLRQRGPVAPAVQRVRAGPRSAAHGHER